MKISNPLGKLSSKVGAQLGTQLSSKLGKPTPRPVKSPFKNLLADRFSDMPTHFLGLKSRLSQAWIAQPLICMVIFIVKLQLLKTVIDGIIYLTTQIALHECQNYNKFSSKMADANIKSLQMANSLINHTVEQSVEASKKSLIYTLKAINALVIFALELTIGTYACLTVSAVDMVSNQAINATEFVIGEANQTARAIGHEINDGLDGLSKFINGATGLLNSVTSFITGGEDKIKSVNLTVSKLDNLNISSDIYTELEELRTKIPTYEKTESTVKKAIGYPFDTLESHIDQSEYTSSIKFQLDQTPIDGGTCDMSDALHFINKLKGTILTAITAICIVCGLVILFGILFRFWQTRHKWRKIEEIAYEPETTVFRHQSTTAIPVQSMNQMSFVESNFLQKFLRQHLSYPYSYIVQYTFNTPLLAILGIGLAGIIVSLLELAILSLLVNGAHEANELLSAYANNLSDDTEYMYIQWQTNTNKQIKTIQDDINENVLGWMHNSSAEINNTVSTFMDTINDEINDALGGTFLLKPMQSVVGCLIGNKVENIEKGLTWINENTEVTLPLVQNLTSSDSNSTELDQSKVSTDSLKSSTKLVLQQGIDSIRNQINTQFIVSGIFIAVWAFFVLACIITTVIKHQKKNGNGCPKLPKNPPDHSEISDPVSTDLRFAECEEKDYDDVPYTHLPPPPLDRKTRFFNGPDHKPQLDLVQSNKAQIFDPDSPRTPLKAMMDRDHL